MMGSPFLVKADGERDVSDAPTRRVPRIDVRGNSPMAAPNGASLDAG